MGARAHEKIAPAFDFQTVPRAMLTRTLRPFASLRPIMSKAASSATPSFKVEYCAFSPFAVINQFVTLCNNC